jgi:hypothetical protein
VLQSDANFGFKKGALEGFPVILQHSPHA